MPKLIHFENSDKKAIVDDEDYEKVSKYSWYLKKDGRAITVIDMARIVLDDFTSEIVDHKDLDGLNNQRSNLRPCTKSQNHMNRNKNRFNTSSKFKGVSYSKERNQWRAIVYIDKKQKFVGWYDIEVSAAKAYDKAAKKYYGEFARLNFGDK